MRVQVENEGLRSNQSVLLAEVLSLRRELAAVDARAGVAVSPPSASLQSLAHHQHQGASSSGVPASQSFVVRGGGR